MRFDISAIDPANVYKLLTATVVPRPIAWVSTRAPSGLANLAPFSFFNVMGDEPPILAVGINRGARGMKDTARNIVESGEFVVNLVPFALAEAMNLTAIDAPPGVSEFALAGLTEGPASHVSAPLVAESPVSFECVTHASLLTGPQQVLAVGRVLAVHVADRFVKDATRGHIDTPALDLLGRGFGSSYIRSRDMFDMTRPRWADQASSTNSGS
ncbi:MAG: flavin reductase family protein [Gemmobacter sp.]|uniref:flavin reductase family protein n=1 Tax=Gemmobacter sp. TaxID=1898957 RepID=UPI001A62398C|nr:flavin reductase family protein [Gemmobacter sp.]MBL8563989.1 flavin reductase family protein [Gemmobacter sp.]